MNARTILQRAVLLGIAALAAGCHQAGKVEAETDPPSPPAAARDGAVTVAPDMLPSITVAAMTERETSSALTLSGKVQFDEDRVARVLAPLAGQVVDLHAKIGDRVAAGQTLCAISSREAAAAAEEYIESRTDLDLAEKQAALTRDLYDHQAASRIALQQSENDLGKAQARLARTGESLRVLGLVAEKDLKRFNGRLPITTPIAGVVVDRKVTEGQFVQADSTPLVTVASLESVWVMGDLFERDLRLVDRGQPATVTTTAYPGEIFKGRVGYISDTIDPSTRTAKVRVSVANPAGRLKPEMFVSITLQVADHVRAVTVPSAAVFTEHGQSFVYVEVGHARFARRPIDVTQEDGTDRRVLAGLAPGERVVVAGVLLLREEEKQRAG